MQTRKRSSDEIQGVKMSQLATEVHKVLNHPCAANDATMGTIANLCRTAETYIQVLRELRDITPRLLVLFLSVPLWYSYRLSFADLNEIYEVYVDLHTRMDVRIAIYGIQDLAAAAFRPDVDSMECKLAKEMPVEFHLRYGDLNCILENNHARQIPDALRKILRQDSANLSQYAVFKELGVDKLLMLANSTIITKKDASWSGLPERFCYIESLSPLKVLVLDLIGTAGQICTFTDGKLNYQRVWNIRKDVSFRDIRNHICEGGKLYTFLGNKMVPRVVLSCEESKPGPRVYPPGNYYLLTFKDGSVPENLYRAVDFLSHSPPNID